MSTIDFEAIAARPADFVIGGEDDPYLRRWYLLPRNEHFNVYLHQFLRDDDDRALHDHPWASFSLVLSGCGVEYRQTPPYGEVGHGFRAGDVFERSPEYAHRIKVLHGPIWTLFVTGPKVREWGLHCPDGWKHWRDFVSSKDSGLVGPGCGGIDP